MPAATPTPCPRCHGDMKVPCPVCGGDGMKRCPKCHGTGEFPAGTQCPTCKSLKEVACTECDKVTHQVTCWICKGTGHYP